MDIKRNFKNLLKKVYNLKKREKKNDSTSNIFNSG
jgi:hypothetical protein